MRERFLILSLFILLFLSVPIIPVNASDISQEKSFSVNPLPFWNIASGEEIINYQNQYVNISTGTTYDAWLNGWNYRRPITIVGSTGAGTNYQVRLNITYDSNMQSDFDDLRFTSVNGVTELDYWRENYTVSTSAVFWVEVSDSLESSATIYEYYGNPSVSTTSNGTNTFLSFDHWSTIPTTNLGDGSFGIYSSTWLYASDYGQGGTPDWYGAQSDPSEYTFTSQSSGIRMRTYWDFDCNDAVNRMGYMRWEIGVSGTDNMFIELRDGQGADYGGQLWIYDEISATSIYASGINDYPDFTGNIEVTAFEQSGNDVWVYVDDSYIASNDVDSDWTFDRSWNGLYARHSAYPPNDIQMVDWQFISKFVSPEPTPSIGTEEPYIDSFFFDIPITSYKNQKIQTMININELNDSAFSIRFSYDNSTTRDMNTTITEDTIYCESQTINITSYAILRMEFELKHSVNEYTLSVSDVNGTKIDEVYLYHDIDKLLNTISFSSLNFSHSEIIIYHLGGDIEYRSDWEISQSSSGAGIYQASNWLDFESSTTSYSATYTLYMSGFQFWRAEPWIILSVSDWTPVTEDFSCYLYANFSFFDTDGVMKYRVRIIQSVYSGSGAIKSTEFGLVSVRDENESSIYYNAKVTGHTTQVDDYDFGGKVAVWRSQENYLGVKSYGVFNDNESEFAYWESQDILENYQCEMKLWYIITHDSGVDVYFSGGFGANEYAYNLLTGSVEPHFSTNWWDNIPIIGAIINGFIWVGNAIVAGIGIIVSGAVALFTPLFNYLGGVFSAVGAILEGALNTISATLSGLASGIWGFFSGILDTISSGVGSLIAGFQTWIEDAINTVLIFVLEGGMQTLLEAIANAISDVFTWLMNLIGDLFGITDLGTSVVNFFGSFATAITGAISFITTFISWGASLISYLVTIISLYGDDVFVFVTFMIAIDVVDILITSEFSRFEKYYNIIESLGSIMFRVVNAVIQFVGGVIP